VPGLDGVQVDRRDERDGEDDEAKKTKLILPRMPSGLTAVSSQAMAAVVSRA
jgi:hypothetical protein